MFDGLGTKVTVVNRSEKLLRHLDEDIVSRFNEIARERFDVRIANGTQLTQNDSGVSLSLDDGSTVEAEAILVATGRKPNADLLGLDSAGIELREDGRIKVDEYGRTSVAGVWALGDVSSPTCSSMWPTPKPAQCSTISYILRICRRCHMISFQPQFFTHPQIASVGLTEADAREQGFDIAVKVQNYGDVAYGWAMEDSTGICKLVADRKTGRLLGPITWARRLRRSSSSSSQQWYTALTCAISRVSSTGFTPRSLK